ncbi:MAG TPA: sigma-54-dependent Fis family transcriptional regulator [Rhodobiaceae bacterium]|nr:sigma-54-dependent Fis family transcriptional regulator [Rhodobiaceae bacterium]
MSINYKIKLTVFDKGVKMSPSDEIIDFENTPSSGTSISGQDLLSSSNDKISDMPDISDLSKRIKFAPDKGHIWFDQRRMFLLHSRAFGALRHNMIENAGASMARAILMRTGYTAGSLDAEMASRVRKNDELYDVFSVGPQMHALLGVTLAECVDFDVDVSKGKFTSEYIWHDSIEDDAHLRFFDIGPDPVCWFQIGYASGFSSVFIGRQIIYKEVECRTQGYKHCRIVGKTYEEWDDASDEMAILQPHLQNFNKTDTDKKALLLEETTKRAPNILPDPKAVMPLSGKNSVNSSDENFIGVSPGFQVAFNKLNKVAKTDATVLFLGNSGVGKEIFAKKLHRISLRSDQPFIAVNCAAIPEDLIESELFGVEKGAYTGAVTSRKGRFERADGGTLFLDEIGTLSLSAQGKLLRALQEKEFERVGDEHTRKVNTRVVAATNQNLLDEVKAGNFREDLYFRLNVFPINIPPLASRRPDIPLLINHFFKHFSETHNRTPSGFSERAINALFTYDWPGNIREMENMIERGVILAEPDMPIDIQHLFTSGEKIDTYMMTVRNNGHLDKFISEDEIKDAQLADSVTSETPQTMDDVLSKLVSSDMGLEELESEILKKAVNKSKGNLSKAARMLGITRPQLAYRLKKSESYGT